MCVKKKFAKSWFRQVPHNAKECGIAYVFVSANFEFPHCVSAESEI